MKTKKEKNIWVFHPTATPPNKTGLTRPYNFSIRMMKENYKTTIFPASHLHYSNKNLIMDKSPFITEEYNGTSFVYVNTPSSFKNNLSRVKNILFYYKNLLNVTKEYLVENDKPDIIIASSPHPLAMVAGIKIAKKLNIPCVCEVRDFWPEAIFTLGKLKEDSVIGKILTKGEKWIYKRADGLIFLKEGDHEYLKERNWTTSQGGNIDLEKCFYINNGVNLDAFDSMSETNILYDDDLENEKFKVVYTGAIRPVNNVSTILDAAKKLVEHKDILFLIYGDGNELGKLSKRIKDEKITNVVLKGYVDKRFIPYILNQSSVNLLHYSQDNYNWTRGNSSNKLFEYMASGKPIISSVKIGYSPIEKYNCGITLDEDTSENLAQAILEMYKMPQERYKEFGENSKLGAKDFDFNVLAQKLTVVVERLIK